MGIAGPSLSPLYRRDITARGGAFGVDMEYAAGAAVTSGTLQQWQHTCGLKSVDARRSASRGRRRGCGLKMEGSWTTLGRRISLATFPGGHKVPFKLVF